MAWRKQNLCVRKVNCENGQIKIRPGSDNTSTYNTYIEPTSGNSVYVTPAANITISGNETTIYKELVIRPFGINEVISRPSCAGPSGGQINNLDQVITNMIIKSYVHRLDNKTQYFGFENIVEDVD